MQKSNLYNWLFLAVMLSFGCQQARDLKAFTEADYRLQGVENVQLNGIDMEERMETAQPLSPQEQDNLLAAVASNSLLLSANMHLFVSLREPSGDQTLTIMSMKWLLLVDGEEALSGMVEEKMVLHDGLNTIPIRTPVQLTEADGIPNYEGLSRVLNLINRKENLRQALSFQIKPTIQTPIGNIESPKFITVSRPTGASANSAVEGN